MYVCKILTYYNVHLQIVTFRLTHIGMDYNVHLHNSNI